MKRPRSCDYAFVMPVSSHYKPEPVHATLGEGFFDAVTAATFPERRIRYRNARWAARVGLDGLTEAEWSAHFGGFKALPGNLAQPLALRYHGHQFRVYNPEIGDGRGFLFAQLRDVRDGRLLDLATKGSGRTPYSRSGDGRLTLKGGVREVLITNLLEALGVNTSKSFSLIETGEQLARDDEPSPTRSSVLVRLGHSHIRFGSFQRQAYENSPDRLWQLLNYSIAQYHPDLDGPDTEEKVAAFVKRVAECSADLVASWIAAGFVHGVLNSDNMTITGESFDYGPYRMLPVYDPHFTAAYFDQRAIYAYGRQPSAVYWNLNQLAGALSLICEVDKLADALEVYPERYSAAVRNRMIARLGLAPRDPESDDHLTSLVLEFLRSTQIGFERFFFDWYGGPSDRLERSPLAALYAGEHAAPLAAAMKAYAPLKTDPAAHAYFENGRPATLLIDEIESIWAAIDRDDDWAPFNRKLADLEGMRQALAP